MATQNQRTPWQNRAEYEKLAGRQVDVQDVIAQLRDALDPANLEVAHPGYSPEWAKYGHPAVDPTTKTFVQPTMYRNQQYEGSMKKQLSAALSEDAINRAAMELFAPYTPAAPRQPRTARPQTPTKPPGVGMGAAGVIGVLLDLLSYSGDTNSNESEALAKKQPPTATNRPEYEALLQQVLNSGTATFPTK